MDNYIMLPPILFLTLPLILHRDANSLQQTVSQRLQSLVVIDGDQEALWRTVGDGLELLPVSLSHPDAKHYDSLLPQALGGQCHIIRRVPICDDHSDLRHPLAGSAARLFGEVLRQEEVHGLARFCAPCSVGNIFHCSQQGILVHVILQQELLVRFIAVLRQADSNFVEADVEGLDDVAEKLPDLLKAIIANAAGAIN